MSKKAGIVGKPNAGKSTFFNALMQKSQAQTASYAFCTIKPNVGKVPVVDERLEQLQSVVKTQQIVPTRIDFVDIAGLIKGASKGEGLGNSFLDNIRNVDLIIHVLRGFTDPQTGEAPCPAHDMEIVNTELILSDIQRLEGYLAKNKRSEYAEIVQKAIQILNEGGLLNDHAITSMNASKKLDVSEFCKSLGLLTIKPKIIVLNVDEQTSTEEKNKYKVMCQTSNNTPILICNAAFEYELSQLPDLRPQITDIDRIIQETYKILDLITFFTAGEQEIRAWTAHKGDYIHIAAGAIHNDFSTKFIRAEVVGFDDFITCKGWIGSKECGKLRIEGKQYVVQDGDVCFFRI